MQKKDRSSGNWWYTVVVRKAKMEIPVETMSTLTMLHKWGFLNRSAKMLAKPLSLLVCSRLLYQPFTMIDAYLNYLLGKGAGSGGDLESEVNAALSLIHRPEPVIFDVGANVGLWSELFSAANPAARLLMFEPSPECRKEIANRPSLRNASVIPAAVGAQAGRAFLFFSEPTDQSASLYRREDAFFQDRTYSQIEVDTVTIDDVIKAQLIEFVDFLKMDIEGHELFALHGAKDALSERRIGAMLFEFGSGNINSQTFFHQFWDLDRK